MNATHIILLLAFLQGIQSASLKKEVKQTDPSVKKDSMQEILKVNAEKEIEFFEGDIILPHHDPQQERNAIADPTLKWTFNIPYEIHSHYTYEVRETIKEILREFSVRMCVNFVPRQNENNYLLYKKEGGCFSSVGMIGGPQVVSLADGCESTGVIKHETMHALGFWHEQSRYDRDEHVQILWENIQSGKEHNFNKYSPEQISTLGVPYDYSSIMHYNDYAFSSNGEPTIVALNTGGEAMGQRVGFSEKDLVKLRTLYQCESVDGWTEWTDWGNCDLQCQKQRKRFCEGSTCTQTEEIQSAHCDSSCVVGRDHDCPPRTLTASHGTVMSSMYPFVYKVNVECTQTIIVPDGQTIDLRFEFLDIEDYQGICYYDWLKIYDGADSNSPVVGTFCGQNTPGSIRSTGSQLTLHMLSDVSVSQRGFVANYYAVSSSTVLSMCHFEGDIGTCGWTHDESGDFNWSRNYGATVSDGTGPSVDHTTEEEKGYYLFIETSSPQTTGMLAKAKTPTFPAPTSGHCLEFYYNMFGENIDTLSVILQQEVSPGTTESLTVFSMLGNHGNQDWLQSKVNIYGQYQYNLVFQGRRGNGWKGDIAIDDVTIHSVPCEQVF